MTLCSSCGDQHSAEMTVCPRTGQSMLGGPCGTRLARYEVERLLGDGGMGAVYRARHVMLNQHVAVKLLHAEFSRRGDMVERFLREARAAAAIGNPHIIRVHDCDVTPEGRPFLVMELLEGEGLDALLRRERRLSPPRVVALAQQMLDGLGAAHVAGIIHRDMKPANVFVRKTPDPAAPEFVTVLDFGISKMADPSGEQQNITQTGAVIGTPVYMAPEQIMSPKDISHRADIYATGVMIYEMLSGRLPYEGANTAELIVKACTVPPTPLREAAPDLPQQLIEVVDRAMAREASARWSSAAEFADALRRSLGGAHALPTSPQGSGPGANVWSPVAAPNTPAPSLPVTAFASMATPSAPLIPSVATPSAPMMPSMATPSGPHWGAIATSGPNVAAFAPPPANPGGATRTVLLVFGVIGALITVCCVGSMVLGWFANQESSTPAQPQMTPIAPPQSQITPVAPPHVTAMAPSQPQMVPVAAPHADPHANTLASIATGEGVEIGAPEVVGLMSIDAIERALAAAAPSMARCRMATAQTVSVLAIVQADGRVAITRPADENTGDHSAAQCVGNRFAAQGVQSPGGGGIVTFTARLAPR